jgi:hypothetical protein
MARSWGLCGCRSGPAPAALLHDHLSGWFSDIVGGGSCWRTWRNVSKAVPVSRHHSPAPRATGYLGNVEFSPLWFRHLASWRCERPGGYRRTLGAQ